MIQPSPADPDKIQAVMLMARAKDPKDIRDLPQTSERAMTPARRAWIDARRNLRGTEETEAEVRAADPAPTSVEAAPLPAETSAPTTIPSVTAAATPPAAPAPSPKPGDAVATDSSQQLTPGAVAAPTETASAAPVPDTASDSPAAKEVQEKISSMQQLFEQRKQMIQAQSAPKDPQH